jgi:hypothetical protein
MTQTWVFTPVRSGLCRPVHWPDAPTKEKHLQGNTWIGTVNGNCTTTIDSNTLADHQPGKPSYTFGLMKLIARSAMAAMVRLGLTPTLAGMAAPSQTSSP